MMNQLKQLALLLLFFPALAFAQCGGLCLYEIGAPDNAAAAAGASARAEDATTAFWNPAGMARLDQTQMHTGLVLGYSNPEIDIDENRSVGNPPGATDNGGGYGGIIPLGGTSFVHRTTEDLSLGISFGGTVGGSADFGSGWLGRQYLTEVELSILAARPAVAYQISEMISVGAFVGVNYGFVDWKLRGGPGPAAPTIKLDDGDDWDVNGGVGVHIQPQDGTRIGIHYQSEIDMTLSGDVKSSLPVTGNFRVGVQTPQGVNVGLYQDLTDQTALLFDVGWSDWSTYDAQPIQVGSRIDAAIPRNFDDTWRVGAGLQHQPEGSSWTFRGGMSYDSNPVSSSDRLPDTAVSDVWRFSLGSEKEIDSSWSAGWSYTFAYFPNINYRDVTLLPNSPVRLTGETDDEYGHFFGVYFQHRFGEKS